MSVSAARLRHTLRLWASGVAVVTTRARGLQLGMTVSAFSSLCLEPPLVLVCVHKEARVSAMVQEAGVFAISILRGDQAELSDRFAGRVPLAAGEDRFDGVETHVAETGSPILSDAIGWMDCKVHAVHDGVTHWIVVGEVLATESRHHGDPLVYFDRDYRQIERERVEE